VTGILPDMSAASVGGDVTATTKPENRLPGSTANRPDIRHDARLIRWLAQDARLTGRAVNTLTQAVRPVTL